MRHLEINICIHRIIKWVNLHDCNYLVTYQNFKSFYLLNWNCGCFSLAINVERRGLLIAKATFERWSHSFSSGRFWYPLLQRQNTPRISICNRK